ncbi:MAG: MBL fold metallo-hydrolase [Chloroflexi bacterium]|nr:MBL fold metallo-hydrolase [Chloroflexota bacterium]MBU1749504.1 MBL fold metallo-hydrolase [Chloroflexota bacterium]
MSIRFMSLVALLLVLALVAGCEAAGSTAPSVPTASPVPTTVPPAATAVLATSEPAATATARVPTVVPPTVVGAAALGEAPAPGDAVIWYLGNCGYAVRTQSHFLVFDYQQRYDGPEAKPRPAQPSLEKGFVVPGQLADLRVRVFVSHQHTDHYDPSIFTWQQTVSDIAYFLGWQARETDDPAFHFLVGPRAAWQSSDMEVYTINSHHSDVPEVAYLVKVDGLVIYHNGDYQGDFRQDYPFLQEISAQIDLAFAPNDYDEQSPYYFPQNVDLFQRFAHRAIFPMHDSAERGHYADFARVYLARLPGLPIHYPQHIGERFLFQDGRIVVGGPAAATTWFKTYGGRQEDVG